jgi:hypothetical protein
MIRPNKIRLEASSACQLSCPACPRASGATASVIGSGHLKIADFAEIVAANIDIREIELSNYGEIFLNPDLLAILEFAHRKGVDLTADNGTNLNTVLPDVLEGLVKYRLRRMTCSIDGATAETYAKYRVGGDFHIVVENLRAINAYKRQFGSPYPILTWQFVVFSHNRHELEKARSLAGQLGMKFASKLSWKEDFSQGVACGSGQVPDVDIPSRRMFRKRYGVEYTRAICSQLWVGPQINWDGRVLGCCRNFWGEFGGNAFAEGVLAVSNSERIGYARGMLLGRNPPREDVPCATCEQYLALRRSGRWLTLSETRLSPRVLRWTYRNGLAHPIVFSALANLARSTETVQSMQIKARRMLRRFHVRGS